MAEFTAQLRAAALAVAVLVPISSAIYAAPISVVAAENVYGDVAQQMGGDRVSVVSILTNPAGDPHLFEATSSTARAVSDAKLVIYNGAGYDPWMPKLLGISGASERRTIVVADLLHLKEGSNPHFWYNPLVATIVAQAIARELWRDDDDQKAAGIARFQEFDRSMQPVRDRMKAITDKYRGEPVTATEPVFDYMAEALGLEMRNADFQRAIMNDTEPAARDVADFEDDLKSHKVRVLIYNTQASSPASERMKRIAEEAKIPVVGVSETLPSGRHYQDWIATELDALDAALDQDVK